MCGSFPLFSILFSIRSCWFYNFLFSIFSLCQKPLFGCCRLMFTYAVFHRLQFSFFFPHSFSNYFSVLCCCCIVYKVQTDFFSQIFIMWRNLTLNGKEIVKNSLVFLFFRMNFLSIFEPKWKKLIHLNSLKRDFSRLQKAISVFGLKRKIKTREKKIVGWFLFGKIFEFLSVARKRQLNRGIVPRFIFWFYYIFFSTRCCLV